MGGEVEGIGFFLFGMVTAGLLAEVARVVVWCVVVRIAFRKELKRFRQ